MFRECPESLVLQGQDVLETPQVVAQAQLRSSLLGMFPIPNRCTAESAVCYIQLGLSVLLAQIITVAASG